MRSQFYKEKIYEHGKKCALRWIKEGLSTQEIWDYVLDWNPWDGEDEQALFNTGVRLILNAGIVVLQDGL